MACDGSFPLLRCPSFALEPLLPKKLHTKSQDKLDRDEPERERRDKKKEKRNSKHQEIFDKEMKTTEIPLQPAEAVILSETVWSPPPLPLLYRSGTPRPFLDAQTQISEVPFLGPGGQMLHFLIPNAFSVLADQPAEAPEAQESGAEPDRRGPSPVRVAGTARRLVVQLILLVFLAGAAAHHAPQQTLLQSAQ